MFWGDDVTPAQVVELKRKLDGGERVYHCTLVHAAPGWSVLQYVLPAPAQVGTLGLPAGSVTIAHYWTDRVYTAYHWMTPDGRTLGIYLNAASHVEIAVGVVRWRDLELDVLVWPGGRIDVLDDDEASRAPAWAHPAIGRARDHLLPHAAEIARDVETLTRTVWAPRAAAERTSL